jgi:hypothetical protein
MKTFKTLALVVLSAATLSPSPSLAVPVVPVAIVPAAKDSPQASRLREAAARLAVASDIFEAIGAIDGLLDRLTEVAQAFGQTAGFPLSDYQQLSGALRLIQDSLIEKVEGSEARTPMFVRGDSNSDGVADLSDAVHILAYQFTGGATPGCLESADVNDDHVIDVSDPVSLLGALFGGSPNPPAPYPACGSAAAQSSLSCEASTCPAVIFRQAGGSSGGGRLSFTCSGGLCSCTGEQDCIDMFGGSTCAEGSGSAICYDILGVTVCYCRQALRTLPGGVVKPPVGGGVILR